MLPGAAAVRNPPPPPACGRLARWGGSGVLDDLGAGVALAAAIQDAPGGQRADLVRPPLPPERPFAAGLVELHHQIGLGEPEVQGDAASRDDRPGAVVDLAIGLILREAEVDQLADERARLRAAAGDHPLDAVGRSL